mgnify:CR=1 FL=1
MTALGILWFVLIAVLICGYFVLDGMDLGVGVLYPVLGKTETDKRLMMRSIGPVWDGNEVWLLTAGGALFAAFAPAYATTFSGFYLAIMLVLFGLILRAVSVEFVDRDPAWAKVWNICFFVGSLLPALLFGVAVGNIYAGVPLNANGDYAGFPLLGLVTPFTLLCGLVGLSMFMAAGASWIALKAPEASDLRVRASSLRRILQIVALALFLCLSVFAHFGDHPPMVEELAIVRFALAALFVIAMAGALLWNANPDRDLHVFVLQSAAAVVLVFLLAASMFPTLVVASPAGAGASITVATAASSDLALGWMTGIACIGVPLVLFYHVFVYRAFRGRIE